jgi:hypothetical protein
MVRPLSLRDAAPLNHFLATLEASDFEALEPHMELILLTRDQLITQAGRPATAVSRARPVQTAMSSTPPSIGAAARAAS